MARPRTARPLVVALAAVLASCAGCAAPSRETGPASPPVQHGRTAPSTTARTTAPPSTATSPARPDPRRAQPPGTWPVAVTTLHLVDLTRPTVAFGREVAPTRTLTTTVWYPADEVGPFPLVVFAMGFQIGLDPYRRICRLWASAGYVVAAPAFPLTDQAVAGADLDEGDKVNQPADVSFVISSVLHASGAAGVLHGRVRDDVAVAGHSDGADTVLAVGYEPGDIDRRVRAVLADGADPLPDAPPPIRSTVPLLLVHGTADTIVPFSSGVEVTHQLLVPGWFVQLLGADHLPPIEGPSRWTPLLDRVSTDFFDAELKGADPGRVTADLDHMPVARWEQLPA